MYKGNKNKKFFKNSILDILNEKNIHNIKIWVEPFGGSFGMYKGVKHIVDKSVYNDIDEEVFKKYAIGDINHNLDWKYIINLYDKEDTVFYLDPPYYDKEHYYKSNFDEHIELRNKLTKIKGEFIVSYWDSDFIQNLYSDRNHFQILKVNNSSIHHQNEIFIYKSNK